MKFRTTLFFIILFVGVLMLFISQNKKEAARVEEAVKSSDDFKVQVEEKSMDLKPNEQINFIQVQEMNQDEAFWLEKKEEAWHLVYPVRALADQSLAQGMAGMVKLALSQKLIKPEGQWEEYGLENPEMKIGVGTTENSERHFIYLGKEAPFGRGVFARWDDKQAYFVLPQAVKAAFRKSVYEMREKRVFMTPVPKIDRIYIQIGEQTFDWTLKNGIWYWMEPLDLIGKTISSDQMMVVIQALVKLYVKEFVDEAQVNDQVAGITMLSDHIQIRSGDHSEDVYLGREEALKTAYYARRENEKGLILIDQTKVIGILELLNAINEASHAKPATAAKPEAAA